MKKAARILIRLSCGLLISACSSSPKGREAHREQTTEVTAAAPAVEAQFVQEVKDEVTVGQGMAARLLGTFGHYQKNPGLERYVNLVGLTLAQQSGRPELSYHFAILDTAEINALSTPGGYVFLTRGLMQQLQSEDELACVLGHELAHIGLKHMYKEIAVKRDVSSGEMLTRLFSRGGADIGGAMNELVSKGMKMLLEDGLGHEKEKEADAVGEMFAAASGYDPSALMRVVARLESKRGKIKMGKTHPAGKERYKALQDAMESNGLKAGGQLQAPVLARRFAEARGGAKL